MIRFFRVSGIALLRFRPYDRRRCGGGKARIRAGGDLFRIFFVIYPGKRIDFPKSGVKFFNERLFFDCISQNERVKDGRSG